MKPGYTGVKRMVKATVYSLQGLRAAWRHESAFRQEFTLGIVLVPCAFLLAQTLTQAALLIAVYLLVLVTELLERRDLGRESFAEIGVLRMNERQHLDGGRITCLRVCATVNRAHSATADDMVDLVGTKLFDGHDVRLVR